MSPFLIAIVIVFLAVIGPVLVFRPSPRQKQLERLRRAALGHGLQVRVAGRSDEGAPEAEYLLLWRDRKGARAPKVVWRRDETGLCTLEGDHNGQIVVDEKQMSEICASLHPCCREIKMTREGVSILWAERGTEERVAAIAEALVAISSRWLSGMIKQVGDGFNAVDDPINP